MVVQVPMIDAAGVSAALPPAACIEMMENALRAFDRGDAVQPMRSVIQLPDGSGSLYTMPAFTADPRALVVKMITIFHGNHGTSLPSHQGVVVVFDTATGAPALLLDAARLTALRTAAVSAVATRALARSEASVLAVLGTGVQARSHVEAIPLVRPVREVRLWGRSIERTQQLAKDLENATFRVVVCDSQEQAVSDADIICTTTSSAEPVLRGAWLTPGAHINAVGSSTKTARELDSNAVARSRIFVDSIDAALTEAGDLLLPMREGDCDPNRWTPIGSVLNATAEGRRSEDDITLFKSVGLAIEDAAAAAYIAQQVAPSGGT